MAATLSPPRRTTRKTSAVLAPTGNTDAYLLVALADRLSNKPVDPNRRVNKGEDRTGRAAVRTYANPHSDHMPKKQRYIVGEDPTAPRHHASRIPRREECDDPKVTTESHLR